MKQRIAITGNSGSGKSHLAQQMAADLGVRAFDLDDIFWLPGDFNAKRPAGEVDRLIEQVRSEPAWVVEGVFGELVARFLDEADLLIWLDLPWAICEAGLLKRDADQKLLTWASEYWTRTDLRSHAGHQRMYDEFPGEKRRFTVRTEVDEFVGALV